MPEDNKTPEPKVDDNHYVNSVLANDTKDEYKELKAEYKAARKQCKTIDERKQLMRHYQDDIIELAVQARIAGDTDLNAALNQEIQALTRRLWTGRSNSW